MCIKVASTNLMYICRRHRLFHPENSSILKKMVRTASYCKRPNMHRVKCKHLLSTLALIVVHSIYIGSTMWTASFLTVHAQYK